MCWCGRRGSHPTQTASRAVGARLLHWTRSACVVFYTAIGSPQDFAAPLPWWDVRGVGWVFRSCIIAPLSPLIDQLSFPTNALPSPFGPARRRLLRQLWKIYVSRVLELFDRRVHELWRLAIGQQDQRGYNETSVVVPPSFQSWVPALWCGLPSEPGTENDPAVPSNRARLRQLNRQGLQILLQQEERLVQLSRQLGFPIGAPSSNWPPQAWAGNLSPRSFLNVIHARARVWRRRWGDPQPLEEFP